MSIAVARNGSRTPVCVPHLSLKHPNTDEFTQLVSRASLVSAGGDGFDALDTKNTKRSRSPAHEGIQKH